MSLKEVAKDLSRDKSQGNQNQEEEEFDSVPSDHSAQTDNSTNDQLSDATSLTSVMENPDVFVSRGELQFQSSVQRRSESPVTSSGSSVSSAHRRALSINSRRAKATHLSQVVYNENRKALARSIDATTCLLNGLREMNQVWPIFYPGDQSHKNKQKVHDNEQPLDEYSCNNFQVLKLDLKMGYGSTSDLVSSLEQKSVAALLEEKIIQCTKHLASLHDRINQVASKVLITGDLNSGKSTFCNALLGRHVLPEDQQPCTNVFCEVLDARENENREEVHAVYINRKYDRYDLTTYKVCKLTDLDHLVYEHETYSLLKVFVDDYKPPEQSLLHNGTVDISLIDAPGLNMDSYKTTQLFSRQEEIDLVVFVVNAENHFTLSARDFISAAANEKSLIFIVVNKFDNIVDKSKCMKKILDQVAELSPETHKDARDFVHFVSSKDALNSGSGDPDSGDSDDDGDNGPLDDSDPESRNNRDFDALEASLRDFILEKRSASKLLPSKTYLLRLLSDLQLLAQINIAYAKQEKEKQLDKLKTSGPSFDNLSRESVRVLDKIDHDVDDVCAQIYQETTEKLNSFLSKGPTSVPNIPYKGILQAGEYALAIRAEAVTNILNQVESCEELAKRKTTEQINSILRTGIEHFGEKPEFLKVFHEDAMFSKRNDRLVRYVDAHITIDDFVNMPWLQFSLPLKISLFQDNKKGITDVVSHPGSVSNALTLASLIGGGRVILQSAWLNNAVHAAHWVNNSLVKKAIVPLAALAGLCCVVYVITDIPNALRNNVLRKVNGEVERMGYVHANADRISKECFKVLRYPVRDIRAAYQSKIEKEAKFKEECMSRARDAENGLKYFSKLYSDAHEQCALVSSVSLNYNDID